MTAAKVVRTTTAVLLSRPFKDPPSGVDRHLNQVTDAGRAYFAVLYICLTISTIAVGVTLYTKARIARKLLREDYLLAAAWVLFAFAYALPAGLNRQYHVGAHIWNLQLGSFRDQMKMFYVLQCTIMPTMVLLKTAIMLQCLRIFAAPGHRNLTFWTFNILIWANIVFWVVIECLILFGCRPLSKSWDVLVKGGRCYINGSVLSITSAMFNAIVDLVILVLCQRVIWHLRSMAFNTRLGISTLFVCGLFASVSSILRTYYSVRTVTGDDDDITYYRPLIGMYMILEFGFGFLVACLPTTPKFFNQLLRTRIGSKISSKLSSLFKSLYLSRSKSFAKSPEGVMSGGRHVPTIGARKDRGRITDIEYHELVVRTNPSQRSMVSFEDEDTGRPEWAPKPPPEVLKV